MAKKNKDIVEEVSVEEVSSEGTETVETVSETVVPVEKQSKEISYPEGSSTGKFHAVPLHGGYVVYNPSGQRATGILTKIQADDIVRSNNAAAHIKG